MLKCLDFKENTVGCSFVYSFFCNNVHHNLWLLDYYNLFKIIVDVLKKTEKLKLDVFKLKRLKYFRPEEATGIGCQRDLSCE